MPQTPIVDDRTCRHCGAVMIRKRFNGRLEDRSVYRNRVFCGRTCMVEGMKRNVVTRSALLWRARKLRARACEACQDTRKLQAHHCDGNQANNRPANVQTLCKPCHDFWHALLRRRGLPIRGRMPALVDGRLALAA